MMFFDEQLYVEIPDIYEEMEKDRIATMYPYEKKPQIIMEDKESNRFCTFSLLDAQKLASDQAEYAIHVISRVVTGLYPTCLLHEPQLAECGEGKCGWFAFKTAGTTENFFNIMYIYPVNGSMMLGTMGCNSLDEQGQKQLMEIMASLKSFRKKYPYEIQRENLWNRKSK